MTDLSSLSDQALMDLYSRAGSPKSSPDLSSMSDAELTAAYNAKSPGALGTAADMAKQLGSGLVEGVESIPATVPSLVGLAGQGTNYLMKKFAPSMIDPQQEQNQQTMRELATQSRNGGMSQYLPQAETKAGEATRMVGNFIPSALGLSGSVVRNTVGAVTGGLGAYGAGQVAPTPEAKPYFELGGALIGGAAGLRSAEGVANRMASKAVPAAEDIKNAATNTYTKIQSGTNAQPIGQGVVAGSETIAKKSVLDSLADDLSATLNRQGPRASVAPGVHSAIDEIRTAATKGAPDVADLVAARQNLKSFFQNPLPDPNKAGAAKILPQIDAAIERLSPGTMKELRAADANWSSQATGNALDKKIYRAELRAAGDNSGMNVGNKIRQKAADMLLSNKESRGLNAADKTALEGVVKGTTPQNLLRFASNALGGGGGLGATALGLAGVGGAGYATGHPELAGLPVLGLGLRMLANRSIANQAANVSAQIRARSPYAQSLGITGPAPRLTRSEAAKLAALYAIPAMRGVAPISGPSR